MSRSSFFRHLLPGLVVVAVAVFSPAVFAQLLDAAGEIDEPYEVILDQMGDLESRRDPKCYATAARLENFVFGTPLTEPARFEKAELQKALVSDLWRQASERARMRGATIIEPQDLIPLTNAIVTLELEADGDLIVKWPPENQYFLA
ncbi:MAG: hypothetical protein KY432_11840, partial [Acidobacteria bacterium]|nr:hypothetical protein [Acidobacteriota bacterium]